MGTNVETLQRRPPYYQLATGLSTEHGTHLPPSQGKVFYVSATELDNLELEKQRRSTLAAALNLCTADKGDVVYVLPGHAENVTDATMLDNLVAGVSIIGVGRGTNQPKFTWTATAGSWTLDQNDVTIRNLHLDFTGIDAVVKAIDWTGTDCSLIGCDVEVASASAAAAIAVEIGAAADRSTIASCRFRGDVGDAVVNNILVDGACDDLLIEGNYMNLASNTANGCINITAAALRFVIKDNVLYNTVASSTGCIQIGNVAADGLIIGNIMGTKNDGVATAQGLLFGAAAICLCAENYSVDEAKKSGVLTPAAVAT